MQSQEDTNADDQPEADPEPQNPQLQERRERMFFPEGDARASQPPSGCDEDRRGIGHDGGELPRCSRPPRSGEQPEHEPLRQRAHEGSEHDQCSSDPLSFERRAHHDHRSVVNLEYIVQRTGQ